MRSTGQPATSCHNHRRLRSRLDLARSDRNGNLPPCFIHWRRNGCHIQPANLDQHFQASLKHLKDSGACHRGEPYPPIISKEQWLQVQWVTIQRLARDEEL